jgi:hypothetical protein
LFKVSICDCNEEILFSRLVIAPTAQVPPTVNVSKYTLAGIFRVGFIEETFM